MSYRDLASALERIQRLEDEIADLRADDDGEERRRPILSLNVCVFCMLVVAGAVVILVGSWLVNAT